ncbi:dihydroorotate dehydrogenase B catalytic subunit [Candidatus Fermentibacteria bacterium]|nr:MAG: dihydroorotate dehydrogenase B catalytic subunit [Candidatus Fermentibacteria bacterium]
MTEISLVRKMWGHQFSSPLMLASGTAGYGRELLNSSCLKGAGAVVSKAVTYEPRAGNPPPRVQETKYGLLNSIGLANPGVHEVVNRILPSVKNLPCPLLINVAGASVDEFAEVAGVLETSSVPIGYEINVSCPNVHAGGAAFGVNPGTVEKVSSAVSAVVSRPFAVKLTPNGGDIVEAAKAAEQGGASAVTVCNTFLGMDIDWKSGNTVIKRKVAGYTSPALLPLVIARVWQVSSAVSIPVISSGGVSAGEDVLKLMAAGASMVQVGTRLMRRPFAASELYSEMTSLLGL